MSNYLTKAFRDIENLPEDQKHFFDQQAKAEAEAIFKRHHSNPLYARLIAMHLNKITEKAQDAYYEAQGKTKEPNPELTTQEWFRG
jgi:hypothetical protein